MRKPRKPTQTHPPQLPSVPSMRKWAAHEPSPSNNSNITTTIPSASTSTRITNPTYPSDDPSYSTFARVAGGHHPFLEEDELFPLHQRVPPVRTSSAMEAGMNGLETGAELVRSDSIMNRARRVFSLPATLKKRNNNVRPNLITSNIEQASSLTHHHHHHQQQQHKIQQSQTQQQNQQQQQVSARRPPVMEHAKREEGVLPPRRVTRAQTTLAATGLGGEEIYNSSNINSNRRNYSTIEKDIDRKELQDKIRLLESQLEASRVRITRQKKRIAQLEEENDHNRQSLPALETIIKSALFQFQAKEAALRHTIAKIDEEHAIAIAEKNEAMRLVNAFLGRNTRTRSPPASLSSISETGTENAIREGRRAVSVDAFRRYTNSNRQTTNDADLVHRLQAG